MTVGHPVPWEKVFRENLLMTMRVADYIFKTLADWGTKHVFLVTGGGAMFLDDAVGEEKRISYVCNLHEQACAMAAEGYARISGLPGVVCVTTGPGGTNALTGVAGAWLDSIPMIVISGQIKRATCKAFFPESNVRQIGDQELNIVDVVRPITKYAAVVRTPEEIGPVLEKASDLAGLLTSLQENDILFIDEIHRLNRVVEEYLYPAMEDFRLDIMLDSGPAARSVNLPLKHFTLVGATTRSGLLTGPLRDRFGLQYRLELYNEKDIVKILMRSARILGVELSEEAAKILGGRCRGTPRVANRVLRRCRDVAQVRGTGIIDERAALKTLEMLGIDSEGLDPTDRKILAMMIDKFNGGPVGLGTISAAMGEEPDTLEEVYEPYLLQKGLISRTPRGRVATANAYKMLHKPIPKTFNSEQTELLL